MVTHSRSLVLSYLALRRSIGVLGVSLPFILFVGALIVSGVGLQGSISGYYYTIMRNVFVGILWVIGFFLFSYKGYERVDDVAGNLACVFAVGTALFPTAPEGVAVGPEVWIGRIHLLFAGLFFATLIFFCLRLFTKSSPSVAPTDRKLKRNRVYRACGVVMAACIVLIGVYMAASGDETALARYRPVFLLEAIAVVSFGISWLVKGEAVLADL